jgi:hypothetical protein
MAVSHYVVVTGDSWGGIATKLSPVGVTSTQITTFATQIAAQNGTTTATTLVVGRVLHVDEATIPTVVTPPPATVPGAPTSLVAIPGNLTVGLSWTAPANNGGATITGYNVQRNGVFLSNVPGVTYSDGTVTNGTSYTYTVRAVNSVGSSVDSNTVSATPTAPATAPSAPTGLTAVAGNGSVNLSWNAPTNTGGSAITDYEIFRGVAGTGGASFSTNFATGMVAGDVGLANTPSNGLHNYNVALAISGGVARPSAPAGEGYGDCIAFPAQNDISANHYAEADVIIGAAGVGSGGTGAYTGVMVRVTPTSGSGHPASAYNWYKFEVCGDTNNVRFVKIVNGAIAGDQYYPYSIQPNQTYRFRLEANGSTITGKINGSTIFTRTETQLTTGKPGITIYNNTANQTAIDNFSAGDLGAGTGTTWTQITDGVNTSTTFTDTGLTNGVTYSYKVRAKNAVGSSADSTSVSVTPTAPVTPPPTSTISESFNSGIGAFTMLRGNVSASGGVLRPSAINTEVDAYHNTDLGTANHEVSAKFVIGSGTQTGSWFAINARMATVGLSYYSVETDWDRNTLTLMRVVNGNYTSLGSWTPTNWAAGSTHTVKLSCDASAIKVFADGTQVISVTDTGLTTGSRVGIHAYVANLTHYAWEDFAASALGAATPPPATPTTPPVTPPPVTTGEFYTKNGRVGRDGKQFVAVGLNGVATSRSAAAAPGQWWNDTGMGVMNGKSQLFTQLGFNFVRFNDMRDYSQFTFRDWQNGMFDCMDEYLARGVTVMPAYHRVGPGTNPTTASLDANSDFQNYWTEIIDRYKTNPNVWVNPLNEPIGTAWDQWETLGNYQYNLMRNKGWTGIIVIDLPQWAQGINIGAQRMANFCAGKTKVVLGFHNYGMENQTAAVQAAQALGVPFLIGECGEVWPSGADRTSMEWCVAQADALGIGCLGWWGAGNRNDGYVLRQQTGSTFYDSAPLTNFGTKMFALAANRPIQPNL